MWVFHISNNVPLTFEPHQFDASLAERSQPIIVHCRRIVLDQCPVRVDGGVQQLVVLTLGGQTIECAGSSDVRVNVDGTTQQQNVKVS